MRAAERLFLAKGPESTSIEDITQGAGVAKGSFYLHFKSKTEVLEALRARFVEGVLARIVMQVGKRHDEDWHGKLAAWSEACSLGYLDAAPLHDLVFSAAPPPSHEGLTRNPLVEHLTGLLAAGAAAQSWSIDDPTFSAVFLFNALHGVVTQASSEGESPDRRKLLRALEAHFIRTVGLPSGDESPARDEE